MEETKVLKICMAFAAIVLVGMLPGITCEETQTDTTIDVEESYRPPMAPEDIELTYRPPMAPEDIEGGSNGR